MIPRLLRRTFSADAMGLILIITALRILTYGIAASLRNTDSKYFFWFCLPAALISLGWCNGKRNGFQASAGMVALGILGVWILGARLAIPLLDLGNAFLVLLPQIVPAIRSHIPINRSRMNTIDHNTSTLYSL